MTSTTDAPPTPAGEGNAGRRKARGHKRGGDQPKIALSAPIKADIRGGLIGTWILAVLNALFLVLLGVAMNDVLTGEPLSGAVLGGFALLVIARAFMAWLVPHRGARAQGALEGNVRDRVYRNVMGQGAIVRSQEQTGRIVATGTTSVELSSVYYATFLGPIIGAMTTPLIVLVVIAITIDVKSALILLGFVVLIPLTIGAFQRGFQKVSDNYTRESNALSAEFLDALQGLPTLALFNRGKDYGRRLARLAEQVRRSIMRLLLGNQLVLLVVDAAFSLGMITVATWLALDRFADGAINAGQAISLVLLGLLLIEPLDKVGQFFYVGMSGIASSRDIKKLLQTPMSVPDDANATDPTAKGDGSLRFEDVCFNYGGPTILDHVSFELPSTGTVALVGPSGSGKTTITNLIMRFLAPTEGRILLGGIDTATVPADWVRSQVALVAQTTYLFSGTLRDNLKIAREDATDEQMHSALAAADLGTFVATLRNGLDTPVGERGLSVSGGQAQRISLARAFLKDAPYLILDEPTANVDAESESAIVASIERLARGRTVLVVAHRLTTIRNADRIIVLDDGVVVDAGTHDELLSRAGHYADAIHRIQGADA